MNFCKVAVRENCISFSKLDHKSLWFAVVHRGALYGMAIT